MDDLLRLVRRLREPDGCPWDRKQTLGSVRAYLLEEAHEAAAAIDQTVEATIGEPQEGDTEEDGEDAAAALREELGDLLFQVAFVAVLAEERGDFQLADAIHDVHRKMVDRHPHVFGDGNTAGDETDSDDAPSDAPSDAAEVARRWETRKASRKALGGGASILDGVPTSLPSLVAAYRLGQKAAGVGFDWPDLEPVLAKVREELHEVEAEVEAALGTEREADETRRRVEGEIGDLLFAASNLARHLDVDPEAALARTNAKFRRRFGVVEGELRRREVALGDASLVDLDSLWEVAKSRERMSREKTAREKAAREKT